MPSQQNNWSYHPDNKWWKNKKKKKKKNVFFDKSALWVCHSAPCVTWGHNVIYGCPSCSLHDMRPHSSWSPQIWHEMRHGGRCAVQSTVKFESVLSSEMTDIHSQFRQDPLRRSGVIIETPKRRNKLFFGQNHKAISLKIPNYFCVQIY